MRGAMTSWAERHLWSMPWERRVRVGVEDVYGISTAWSQTQQSARPPSACVDVLGCLMGDEWMPLVEEPRRPGADLGKRSPCALRRPLNSDLTFLQAIIRLPPAVCLRIVLLRARQAHLSIVRPVSAASSEVRVAGTSLTASVARVDPHPFQPCRAAESSTASDIVFDRTTRQPLIQ
jgi:hypothetical protein